MSGRDLPPAAMVHLRAEIGRLDRDRYQATNYAHARMSAALDIEDDSYRRRLRDAYEEHRAKVREIELCRLDALRDEEQRLFALIEFEARRHADLLDEARGEYDEQVERIMDKHLADARSISARYVVAR